MSQIQTNFRAEDMLGIAKPATKKATPAPKKIQPVQETKPVEPVVEVVSEEPAVEAVVEEPKPSEE